MHLYTHTSALKLKNYYYMKDFFFISGFLISTNCNFLLLLFSSSFITQFKVCCKIFLNQYRETYLMSLSKLPNTISAC